MNIFLRSRTNPLFHSLTHTPLAKFPFHLPKTSLPTPPQKLISHQIQTFSSSEKLSTQTPPPDPEVFIQKTKRLSPSTKPSASIMLHDLSEITKFRLSLANSSVAAIAYLLVNPCFDLNFLLFFSSTQMIAMSSQTSNQDIEKEYDKLMIRTCNRPLPKNRIEPFYARAIAALLYLSSNAILLSCFPMGATLMANFIFFSYTMVYTPLKRMSPINTTIGAISGSLPPYLGWLAAGGEFLDFTPLGICTYMFAWQFSHFYGILWIYQDDYRKAGFKMIEDPIKAVQHLKIALGMKVVFGSLVFAGLGLNPYYLNNLVLMYGLWKYCYEPLKQFERDPSVKSAKNLKKKSYNHLAIFFGVIFLNNVWGLGKKYLRKENEAKN